MHTRVAGSPGAPVRVLLLGAQSESLTALAPWPQSRRWLRVQAACAQHVDEDSMWCPVRTVAPAPSPLHRAPRTAASWARCILRARRVDATPGWLWVMKRDPWLRSTLRRVDVVVSLDRDTDRVLSLVPELLSTCEVVPSAQAEQAGVGMHVLADVFGFLSERLHERQWPADLKRRVLRSPDMKALDALVDPILAAHVPPALLPVTDMAEIIRQLGPAVGQSQNAEIVLGPLDRFDWEGNKHAGRSGVSAQRVGARLLQATTESALPSEQELAAAAAAALEGADEAMQAGRRDLARARLVDAMCVLFHRERHAESVRSTLVAEPAIYLDALWKCQTLHDVVTAGKPPRLRSLPAQKPGTRILVLSGAYGSFHAPVVAALAHEAVVTVRGPQMFGPFFRRRGLDPQLIEALASVRGEGPSAGQPDPWDAAAASQRILKTLGPQLRRADVVFTDWADRLTVFASHLVPDGVRLVVRIHSLDALHPWFHLVNWSKVDQVLVVSEPLRTFVNQLLSIAGAEVPVAVVPNLTAIADMDRPKGPLALRTLGMIGWGRRVKDPLWALDLLAREPSWRLVLIGRDLHQGQSKLADAYNDAVRSRLADPAIGNRVEIVGWSDDIAGSLTKVGVILSTSRRESWHLGLVEGAASGAVPVVRNWPVFAPVGGARELFPADWVVEDVDEAEARVRRVTDPQVWEVERRRAQSQALDLFDPERVAQQYRELILGPSYPGSAPNPG